LIIFTTDILLR